MKLFDLTRTLLVCFLCLACTIGLQAQSAQYLHFDGQDDYVESPKASQYINGSSEVSMTGWFYTDELVYGQGMMGIRGPEAGGQMYLIQLDNGIIECRFHNGSTLFEYVAPAFSIVPQQWQHIAWVYDGSKIELFIDGVAQGSAPASGTFSSDDKDFAIGKSVFGSFNFVFGGRADEVTLWSKALTAGEIQGMMDNELEGDEPGLELYYKFNQGVPDEDNTSISQLIDEVEPGPRNANLLNFALMGTTSNFGGELDNSFQAITFPQIPNKLISDAPFNLEASASSGLPVNYEIVSGPATINGNTITLDGVPGEVVVKASQPGDGSYDPADDVENTFQVLDPATFLPVAEARSPLAGDVYVPTLGPIQLAAIVSIDYPDLFEVTSVEFEIDGTTIDAKDWENNHYTGWWTPPAYGDYTLNIISTHNYGNASTESINISVVDNASSMTANAGTEVWLDVSTGSQIVEVELPSYIGAFDEIIGNLIITCPPGGCDPWDRVSGIEVKGHNGEWYEIIRYITPYGVACNSSIDLTDFMSILQGKIAFRYYLGTQGNGFEYTLNLDYNAGAPEHAYSTVTKLWEGTYPFGDPANLQPCEVINASFPENSQAAKIKLVSTGHGWGENNTGNAAEFHEDTHHLHLNGQQTFAQHNWMTCNPNPDGCNPQNGTWFHDRAGWCPGAIAPWFDFDLNDYLGLGSIEYKYIFNESYQDICHPNNEDCFSGIHCPDCDAGFNPHLIVSSFMINLGDEPLDEVVTGLEETPTALAFQVFPNPTTGIFRIELPELQEAVQIQVANNLGQVVRFFEWDQSMQQQTIDLSGFPKGIYYIQVQADDQMGIQKLIIE